MASEIIFCDSTNTEFKKQEFTTGHQKTRNCTSALPQRIWFYTSVYFMYGNAKICLLKIYIIFFSISVFIHTSKSTYNEFTAFCSLFHLSITIIAITG